MQELTMESVTTDKPDVSRASDDKQPSTANGFSINSYLSKQSYPRCLELYHLAIRNRMLIVTSLNCNWILCGNG